MFKISFDKLEITPKADMLIYASFLHVSIFQSICDLFLSLKVFLNIFFIKKRRRSCSRLRFLKKQISARAAGEKDSSRANNLFSKHEKFKLK